MKTEQFYYGIDDIMKEMYLDYEKEIRRHKHSETITGAIYIRVSTDKQDELSPDAQLRLSLEYAKKNNIFIPKEYIYVENGISGRKAEKRPKFQRMIALAKSKEHPFDVILVWRFSRFARNQEESIVYKSLLRKNKVDVVSISEPIIDGPFGKLIERIIEWGDEYYSIQLAEDVRRGMAEKAMRGGHQTGAAFGYKKENGVLYPDKDTALIVRKIFEMYLYEGESYFAIARKLNEMGIKTKRGNKFENRTVKYILQNPIYKGYVRWNPNAKDDLREQKYHTDDLIITKSSHEPIIPEKMWNEVNEKILREYRPRYAKPNHTLSHWLGGVLICSSCGSVMVSGGSSGGFQCNAYSKGRCMISHYVSHKKIEASVIAALQKIANSGNFEYEMLPVQASDDNAEILKNNIKKLDQKLTRVKEAYVNGVDTLEEYKEHKARIEAERKELSNKIKQIKDVKKTKETTKTMINRINNVCAIVTSDANIPKKNTAIKSIVKKIIYDKRTENIDVYLFYS